VSAICGLIGSVAYLLAAISILLGRHAGAITFGDGLVHVIDAEIIYPFERALINDGSDSAPTTAKVVTAAEIGTNLTSSSRTLRAFEASIVDRSGCLIRVSTEFLGSPEVYIAGGVGLAFLAQRGLKTITRIRQVY
jgi:hypothetical protein